MPTGMSDFINTFFQAENLKNQREQLAMQQQNSRAQRAQVATMLAARTRSPEGREEIAALIDDPEIGSFLQDIALDQGVLGRIMADRGLRRMGEEGQEEIEDIAAPQEALGMAPSGVAAEQFLSQIPLGADETELEELGRIRRGQIGAGMSPGQIVADLTFADLPEEEQTAFHRIAGGTELSEMQRNQIAQWAAQNNIQWADLAQRGALGTAQLMQQMQLAEMQAQASGGDMPSPNQLMTTMLQAEDRLRNEDLSDQQKLNLITMYNSSADLLSGMGLYPPTVRLSTDPDDLHQGLDFNRMFWFGAGGAGVGMTGGAAVGALGGPFGAGAGALIGGLGGMGIGAFTQHRGGGTETAIREMPQQPGVATQLLDSQGNVRQELLETLERLGLINNITPERQ